MEEFDDKWIEKFEKIQSLKIFCFYINLDNTLSQVNEEIFEITNDILTKDALDEIFEIGHYSLETTKQKRSFFINEINSRGKIKITRQRRVDDQRSYDYLISSIK